MLSRVLTPKVETNKKIPNQDERVKVGELFKNRKFFLDIKGRYPASLVTDIKSLGGVSLLCFSSLNDMTVSYDI